jgi:hypothetical protein
MSFHPRAGDPSVESSRDSSPCIIDPFHGRGGDETVADELSYVQAATCPDCGAGMVRLGLCFTCPLCGFGGCG